MHSDRVLRYLTPSLWCVFAVAVMLALAIKIAGGIVLETDILALLPTTEQDPVVARASLQFNQALSRRHLLVVGADTLKEAIAAADESAARLGDVPGIAEIEYRFDGDRQRAMMAPYLEYQSLLLDPDSRTQMQSGGGRAFLNNTLQLMYSPLVPVSSALLTNDPLLLFYRFASSLAQGQQRVSLRDGVLTVADNNRHYVLINLTLDRSPFSVQLQREFLPPLETILSEIESKYRHVEILNVGVVRYAQAGVESARREISTIGLGSLAGIVVLLWLVFRSPLPLLAALLPIATGFVAAFTACQWLFGSVHLLTLVFGASLIGISIDYSFHYFCDRLGGDASWTGDRGVRHIFNGIALGLLTSVLGYASLCFAPFPGMQQMALFSSVGLAAAFLTVVCLFPKLAPGPSLTGCNRQWITWAGRFADALRWRRSWLLLVALSTMAGVGLLRLTVNDDIRLLQSSPAALRGEEQRVSALLGQSLSNQFLVVEGKSPQQVLEREEQLRPQLQALQQRGQLARFDALSQQLPSAASQRENYHLVRQQLLADPGLLEQYGDALGLDAEILAAFIARYPATAPTPLSLKRWLASEAGKPWQHLWLGATERGYASVIVLYAGESAALGHLEQGLAGVTLVDKVTDISALLRQYRERAAVLVMLSYGLIYGLLCLRYQPLRALRVMIPPATAVVVALGVLGWAGQALNIFHLLALLLVLGIGVDYTLFLEEGAPHRDSTLLAILLSAVTTVLSFGLLALSATPAVAAFGVTVLVGIVVCLLLAPMLCNGNN